MANFRLWHPSRDAYHCAFRFMRLLVAKDAALEIERLRILDMFLLYPSLLYKTSMPQDTKKLFRELDVTAPDKLFLRLPSTAAVFQDLRVYQNSAIAQLTARGLFSTDDLKKRLASPPGAGWPDILVQRALHKNADDGGLTSFLVGAFSEIPLRGRESIYRKARPSDTIDCDMTARLKINRLSVHRGKHVLYDQTFHAGVNIIHGDNGSGKSTIADFLYFGLGGDLREWRDEAGLADYVLMEVSAGDTILTLRRDVSTVGLRPMAIYFGGYDNAVTGDIREWESFPYQRPEDSYSFSQVLFSAIGIPEAISDGVSNITMHQLLRVLYSDQLTPIQRIFRVEPFDTWQTRQAVGDLLCGLGGYDLYAMQLILRDLTKDHTDISTRLRSLISVASSYGDKVLVEFVEATLANTVKERDDLHTQLMALLDDADEAMSSTEADKLVRTQRRDLSSAKVAVATLNDQIETLEFEVADADQFIDHLRIAVNDFDDASSAFFALGAVRFEFCPSCFAPVKAHEHGDKACHLCGAHDDKDEDESRALAVKLDLEMQINESLALQTERYERLGELKSQLRGANARLRAATAASELGRRGAASKYDNLVADISRKIGFLDSQIAQLNHRVALAQEIATLTTEKEQLNERISRIKAQIETTAAAQTRRKQIAYTAVSENVKALIAEDLPEHNDYGDVRSFSFDFAGDWMAINGDKNRVGSASGMVVLKNSFLLSLFISSLNDPQFNLPRFMLMDNIEDKGMVQERSWNFQRLIIKASENSKADHQIIFSTSKIAPELDGSDYVVGGKYTKQRRTLRIGN